MSTVTDRSPKHPDQDTSMVSAGAPVTLNDQERQLFELAKNGDSKEVQKFVDQHRANLNVRDSYNRTPLHFAASEGHYEVVKSLVEGQAAVDEPDTFGITPLLWSVYNNHKNVAVYLMEHGAKYTKTSKQGHTIVHFIAHSGAAGILKHLYKKCRTLKIDQKDQNGQTPFLVAATRGNQLLMEVFKHENCNVGTKDKQQRTALHLAAWKGHANVVSYLLQLPAVQKLIDEPDIEGRTALHLALSANQPECVRLLLLAGANANIGSQKVDLPMIAASRKGYHACIDALLLGGVNKETRTQNGNQAMHIATLSNLPETIYFLTSRGFDLEARNDRAQTPLLLGVEQCKLEAVDALLIIGSRLDLRDQDNMTPMDVAARASYTNEVDMIIKADRWRREHPDQVEEVRKRLLDRYEPPQIVTQSYERMSQPSKGVAPSELMSNPSQMPRQSAPEEGVPGMDFDDVYLPEDDDPPEMFEQPLPMTAQAAPVCELSAPGDVNRNSQMPSSDRQSVSPYDDHCSTVSSRSDGRTLTISCDGYNEHSSVISSHAATESSFRGPASTAKNNTYEPSVRSSSINTRLERAQFQDPYAMFPDDASPRTLTPQPNEEASSVYQSAIQSDLVAPVGQQRRFSVAPSDDLSLGYEACRTWGGANEPGEAAVAADPNHLTVPSEQAEENQSRLLINDENASVLAEEHVLPNGEVLISMRDIENCRPAKAQDPMTQVDPTQFSLIHSTHPYNEEIKRLLYDVAHKDLGPDDWVKLAQFWRFTDEEIAAIQYQDSRKDAYKEQGYRALCIWAHGLDDAQSPVPELCSALSSIGRKKVADRIDHRIRSAQKKHHRRSRSRK
ncbi:unnamed protein product [Calicophoron daubneyi]|uniref:Death domain-containing protein n=1 Tax=Calicophoron daubneyi TaxID=300641 RepID=A0AAV2SYI2_CALDB